MTYFNFSRLIAKYSSDFTLTIVNAGSYDNTGEYTSGAETEVTLTGAIISFKESKLFRAEGTLTQNDKCLYTLQEIPRALKGATVVYEGKKYNIDDETENAKFTGFWQYTLKYVSAFGEVAT